jgi:hypothetical protein
MQYPDIFMDHEIMVFSCVPWGDYPPEVYSIKVARSSPICYRLYPADYFRAPNAAEVLTVLERLSGLENPSLSTLQAIEALKRFIEGSEYDPGT